VKRLADNLRWANSWAAIAVVALIGWLADSLLWFLETHSFTGAGLVAFLSHSWYALPLLIAIFVILRLRQPSELLSLMIYDEQGRLIHRQGDFQLEESVLAPMLASLRSAARGDGLHHIDLPSGTCVYFLRQGAWTLVACFSGQPRPAQLEEGVRLLRQQGPPAEDLLRDLPPDVAALTASLLSAPAARDLLTFLWNHRKVAMTAADLAGQVGHAEGEVVLALDNLECLALVHRQCVCYMTFYRLTDDQARLGRLDQFIAWRVDWLAHAHRVEQLVGPLKLVRNIADIYEPVSYSK
jgi:hypothetical protein